MVSTSLRVLFVWMISTACSQQLQGTPSSRTYPGLSKSCQNALNERVDCSSLLDEIAQDKSVLDDEGAHALCRNSCYHSLESVKTTIASACKAETDVIQIEDKTYPATFIIESYMLAYNLGCRKDNVTGEFCDPQVLEWSKQRGMTMDQSCSDCWLGGITLQLNHPLGYDGGLARNFVSLASRCTATGYKFSSPTPFALKSTAIAKAVAKVVDPPRECADTYTVKPGENFKAISKAFNVSTYSLLDYNYLNLHGEDFHDVWGQELCIPASCETYTWKAYNTCKGEVSDNPGLTEQQFLAWNPQFSPGCRNAGNFHDYQVCVGPPGSSKGAKGTMPTLNQMVSSSSMLISATPSTSTGSSVN